MLNQSGVTKTTGLARKTILFDTQLMFALPVIISDSGISAGSDGKKIVKAGTPLTGDLTNRDTAFTAVTGGTGSAVGILEHDVDVTAGNANGACLTFGFIDVDKLDSDVVSMLSTEIKGKLTGIQFVK